MKIYRTKSALETKKIGVQLGKKLKAGDVVALHGELGSGKTTLVKGIAKGLGVRGEKTVSSPTFVLVHEYKGRVPVYHIDWYRLDKVTGQDAQSAEECFDSKAVTLVEWAERGKELLPKNCMQVRLGHGGADKRTIHIS